MRLADRLADLLADAPGGGAEGARLRDLVAAVRARGGRGVSRAAIERALEGDPRFVEDISGGPGRSVWRLAGVGSSVRPTTPADPGAAADGPAGWDAASAAADVPAGSDAAGTRGHLDALDLRDWQARALEAWSRTGRGVVEAVTGTGKTRLALAAIRLVLDRGGRALVLVPTLELQEQWVRELRAALPASAVGRLGGGHDDDLFARRVVVATPHSAADVPIEPPPGAAGLLVADEAHRYGAPTWGAALRDGYALRLALTATYERNDDGLAEVLEPYFGPVAYRYGYDQAAADGAIAPFRVAVVTTPLTEVERDRHDRADVRARQLHRELVGGLGMPRDPAKLFAAVSAVVAGATPPAGAGAPSAATRPPGQEGAQVRACREYLVRVRERREVAATSASKLELCTTLAPALAGRRTLVFTDTVEQADAAAGLLARAGVRAETVHGGLEADRRRIRLALFRRGDLDVVVAPRVLDEGVDVPDADVAVVLAAFRTRRQLVQRLGRVLRVKPDGRTASLVLAAASGTLEDPARGGHQGFLDQVRGVALAVDRLDLASAPVAVARWLDDGPGEGPCEGPGGGRPSAGVPRTERDVR